VTLQPAALQLERSVRAFLAEGRAVTLLALVGSMFPTLVPGTQLRLEPDADRNPATGDLVVVGKPDGGIAIHRAVRVEKGLVVTWGDALPRPDSWGPSPVLAWPRVLWSPWVPSRWSLLKGHLRARSHLLSAALLRPPVGP
jgi:hypothetical protein